MQFGDLLSFPSKLEEFFNKIINLVPPNNFAQKNRFQQQQKFLKESQTK